jgi:hypothetical protein
VESVDEAPDLAAKSPLVVHVQGGSEALGEFGDGDAADLEHAVVARGSFLRKDPPELAEAGPLGCGPGRGHRSSFVEASSPSTKASLGSCHALVVGDIR